MSNYIKADLKRIFKKGSFLAVNVLFWVLVVLQAVLRREASFTTADYLEGCMQLAGYFSLIVGLPIFLGVYSDDLKAKSMQVAIGFGMSRNKVVLTKLFEVIIMTLVIGTFSALVMSVIPWCLGLTITVRQVCLLVVVMLTEGLRIIGYISLGLPLIYRAQNSIPGLILYLLLASKIIWIIVQDILTRDIFTRILGDTTRFILTNASYSLRGIVTGAPHGLSSYVVVLAYIVIPLLISLRVFKNRELEF